MTTPALADTATPAPAPVTTLRLVITCDRSLSPYVCVQVGETATERWARAYMTWPAPAAAPEALDPLILCAARMVVAAFGAFDLDAAEDIAVLFAGCDHLPSAELDEQALELWIRANARALSEAARLALADVPATVAGSPTESQTVPAASPEPAASSSSSPAGSRDRSATASRQARIIEGMVQRVQQHVQTYGSAPDFASTKEATVARVHNYIRSVTTRQQAPADQLEAVRMLLAGRLAAS